MRKGTRTEWADFFDGHAPEYEQNCFTKNTVAEKAVEPPRAPYALFAHREPDA